MSEDKQENAPERESSFGLPPAERDSGAVEEAQAIPEFVTRLTPVEEQVGMHVIAALQHPETVAVLSTVAMGRDGTQQIVSFGLDPQMLRQVQEFLRGATEEKKQRVPCVGFHCHIREDDDE